MKRILILGAGLVSKPGIEYLLNIKDFFVTVAALNVDKAEEIIGNYTNGKAVLFDIEDDAKLSKLVSENEVVVSLLPWLFHLKVAKVCIDYGKHFLTASYVREELKVLEKEVVAKNLVFLNELGLDPGIDHMSAMKIIHEVREKGGKIREFHSYCGGLPAPKCNNNPFGYKFSWSPRGVLLAAKNEARYLKNGEIVFVENKDLFEHYFIDEVDGLGKFEVYPNRDSLPYRDLYGLVNAFTVKRGTYRNLGWCKTMKNFIDLGLIDDSIRDIKSDDYNSFMCEVIGCRPSDDLVKEICSRLSIDRNDEFIKKIEWLGLMSNEKFEKQESYLDVLCEIMQKKMAFEEGEVDMVVLKHHFVIENSDGGVCQIDSTLIDCGDKYGDSAMSKTVSLPLAIGARLIAEGVINRAGIHIPNLKEIYQPIMAELEKIGIRMDERECV